MPAVSEAQRRAMYAAAEGESRLGIPKKVGEEFVSKDEAPQAAGVVFVSPRGRILLMHRAPDEKNYGGHWDLPSGKADDGETPDQAARREVREETGYEHAGAFKVLDKVNTPSGMVFTTFAAPADKEFAPEMADGEHTGFTWADPQHLPQPLHPSVAKVLGEHIGVTADMSPDDWTALRNGFAKWTREEEAEPEHAGDDSGKLNEKERAEADKTHSEREEMPPEAFLEPAERKYPVKTKGAHGWSYSRDLLLAAAREARMHGHEDLAKRADAIRNREFAQDSLAMDRESVRKFDQDGHLHVGLTPISKAVVNPYYGREIPGWETLRLDGNKVYHLYRDPKELAKGAASFAGKPLLAMHTPVSADDHPKEVTVGAIGDAVEFRHPYLMAPLTVWDGEAIRAIENGDQKELSCGYQYEPDMTPGIVDGTSYDGVMRNIRGNHVALVTEGRAGPDVVVQDAALKNGHAGPAGSISIGENMKRSLMAATAHGALLTYLKPKLAQDAKLDLGPVLDGVTSKTFDPKKMAADVKKAVSGKLAKDQKLDDLDKVLLALDEAKPDEEAHDEEDPKAKLKAMLKDKLSEDDMKACDELIDEMDDEGAMDEDEEEKKNNESEGEHLKDREQREKGDKKAMDAAINAAVASTSKKVAAEVRATERAIRQAEKDVAPYVGELVMTFDSAEEVYRHALTTLGVAEAKTIHASALPTILAMQPKAGAKVVVSDAALGPDMAAISRAAEIAPGLKHIRVGG